MLEMTLKKLIVKHHFSLNTSPTYVAMSGKHLIVATVDRYLLYSQDGNEGIQLFFFDTGLCPFVSVLNNKTFFLKGPTVNIGMIINELGQPLGTPLVTNSEILCLKPFANYIIALTSTNAAIYSARNLTTPLQLIDIPTPKFLFIHNTFPIIVFPFTLHILQKTSLEVRLQKLLEKERYEEADKLFEDTDDSEISHFTELRKVVKTNLVLKRLAEHSFIAAEEILVSEDVDLNLLVQLDSTLFESPFSIDTLLYSLKNAGKVRDLLGLDADYCREYQFFLIRELVYNYIHC